MSHAPRAPAPSRGGTEDYRNARGEGVVDLGPPEGPRKVTLRLSLVRWPARVCNRSDDGNLQLELSERTEQILASRDWLWPMKSAT